MQSQAVKYDFAAIFRSVLAGLGRSVNSASLIALITFTSGLLNIFSVVLARNYNASYLYVSICEQI